MEHDSNVICFDIPLVAKNVSLLNVLSQLITAAPQDLIHPSRDIISHVVKMQIYEPFDLLSGFH